MVLVPATMSLLGEWNWWVPRWLDRILPHVRAEVSDADLGIAPAPVAGLGTAAATTAGTKSVNPAYAGPATAAATETTTDTGDDAREPVAAG
jgi:uncharacterized membrane protein YdfJ with MMPL/SSD domain